ncbi:MAG: phosphoglycerate dehydrogenase [Oscillospiraceae bacterium]|nr:phosphoglycerate dehydrogenase [Candidatus Limimonas coprohippi]
MFKILTLNKISHYGLDNFDRKTYTYGTEMDSPDAIIVRSAAMHDYNFDANTVAVARAGAGVNNIPIDKCAENGIVVFNTPGANANAVKELVICGLFLASRKIVAGIDFAKDLKDTAEADVAKQAEKGKSAFAGPEIKGKKLGVIGLGAIGVLVANAAKGLGMEVYGYDPYLSVDAAWNLSHSIHHAKSMQEIFETCDYITVHVPLNNETRDLINDQSISGMKDGVRILNFARGELVNTDDIIEALGTGKVAAYVTDFINEKILNVPGVVALPHLGASTPESEDNCARMAAFELIDYLENGNIKNSVNMPAAQMDKKAAYRICVIHKNIPNMLNQITATTNMNIVDLLNRSKGDYAYTMLDVDEDVTAEIINAIKAIEGVIRVRVIK